MYKIVIVAVLYLTGNGAEIEIARYTVEMRSANREACTASLAAVGPKMERAVQGDLRETIAGALQLRLDRTLDNTKIRTNSYCRLD